MNVYVEHGLFASQVEECVPILLIADISSLRSSLFLLLLLLLLLLQFLMMVLFWCSTTFLAWLFCSTQKYLKKSIGCRSSFVVCCLSLSWAKGLTASSSLSSLLFFGCLYCFCSVVTGDVVFTCIFHCYFTKIQRKIQFNFQLLNEFFFFALCILPHSFNLSLLYTIADFHIPFGKVLCGSAVMLFTAVLFSDICCPSNVCYTDNHFIFLHFSYFSLYFCLLFIFQFVDMEICHCFPVLRVVCCVYSCLLLLPLSCFSFLFVFLMT